MQNRYFHTETGFNNDVEFSRNYFKIFSYAGIFPSHLEEKSGGGQKVRRCFVSLLLVLFFVGAVSTYIPRIKTVYKHIHLIQVVVDVMQHLAEHLSVIKVIYDATRTRKTWTLNFNDLANVDDKLRMKRPDETFSSTCYVLSIVGYHAIYLAVSIISSYWWGDAYVYPHIIHKIMQFCIQVVIVFICLLTATIRRRYSCLENEVTEIFAKRRFFIREDLVDREIKNVKLIYLTLGKLMERINAKFGLNVFLILSSQLLAMINSFNWFLFDFQKDASDIHIPRQITDLILDPLNYSVSK